MPHRFAPRALVLALVPACAFALAAAHAAGTTVPAATTTTPAAIALPRHVSAGPCIEGICEYTLGNGLRVLLFPDASTPTVTVNLAYGVGSVHENYGETGMAHLLEHLLFKGTPTHADIPGELKKRGIAANATTSFDRTNYFGSFPANDATLAWLLGLEADRMVHSFVAKQDLDSEMTVVRNEMERNENNPAGVLAQRVRSTAFLWHNYGNTTIGARSDVEGVPIGNLQAFYRAWYRPDNATLVVAGRIDPARTLALVNAAFAKVKRPAAPLPAFHTAEPTQDGEREVSVRRSGDMRVLMAAYHVPSGNHADAAALSVLANVLSDTPSGRLHKALVETKLAAGAGAGADNLRDAGLLTLVAVVPKDGDAEQAQAELLRQVEQLRAQPVTAAEVAQAKQRIANAWERSLTDVNAVAMGLTSAVAGGDWRLYFLRRDLIEKVSVDDVNRVARAYFKPSNRTLGRFIPTDAADRAEIPAAPAVATLLAGYTGKAAVAAGETFDPTPANIDARTQSFVLGDGLRVSLLPKDTRGDTVQVSASFRFGDVAAIQRRPALAGSVAGAMLMRGSRTLSREQIAQRLEALRTTGAVSGGIQGAYIGFDSRRDTLADALALAADVLKHPAFPAAEFEQLRLQAITGLEAARKEPGTAVAQALGAHFDPWPAGHPLTFRTLDQQLAQWQALKLADVVAYHRDFYGSAQGEIAIVGDFDPVAVKAQLQQLFAEWKTPTPYIAIDTHYTDVAAESRRLETPDKANAVVAARFNLVLNDTDPDYAALMVANHVLGSSTLASRLGKRLRETEGLTYGVSSSLSADASPDGKDDAGNLSIQAIAAPQNVERLVVGLREEVARLVRDGITATELQDAVSAMLTQRAQARADDDAVAGALARNLYLGRTMAWSAGIDAQLRELGVEQVNAAIRRHFRAEALSVYAAGDFAKVQAGAAAKTDGQ
ncbi:M16 family metallopeptidase [Lysobacter solisilvae (ex Woo and Kim 2020)]|uniref:Insulinase family protein n=1 Tax=Agrilutibacter terrestris TaxID=2865112 RepID=A0A7H0G0Q7_9GAMM|nr:pitrilysin family protein [Lysobacter terrestris]QNP41873.1 insulinase family protein [Lysobacter terrestris]